MESKRRWRGEEGGERVHANLQLIGSHQWNGIYSESFRLWYKMISFAFFFRFIRFFPFSFSFSFSFSFQ
jgi:hypothetical protein